MLLKDWKGVAELKDVPSDVLAQIQKVIGVQPDGIYGPNTAAAFAAFKRKRFLGEPTKLGPSTVAALLLYKEDQLVNKAQASAVYGRQPTDAQLVDLNRCLRTFNINTVNRIRHFLAQTGHESAGLKFVKELANGWAYDISVNRRKALELGNTSRGDGPKYKGAGVIQLTGKSNYLALASETGDSRVMEGVEYVSRVYPFTSAGVWWKRNGMNALIDGGADVRQVTRRVNGGYNGLADRIHYYNKALRYIK